MFACVFDIYLWGSVRGEDNLQGIYAMFLWILIIISEVRALGVGRLQGI
jgi:hypothetical protein